MLVVVQLKLSFLCMRRGVEVQESLGAKQNTRTQEPTPLVS